ncbi:MAG: hypothetical protein SFX74_11275, partial [Fimbriimonadaceae bacterium]|nr:hypothetical protein [Fimbriimonadaceae bacterium]
WPREHTRVNVAYGTASFRDWSIGIDGTAAAVSDVNGRLLVTRYRSHLSEPTKLSERLFMEVGLMICATRDASRGLPLVEIDGLSGRRALFHLPEDALPFHRNPNRREKMHRVTLAPPEASSEASRGQSQDSRAAARDVAVRLSEMTQTALRVMHTGDLSLRQNAECERCRLRTLCRLDENATEESGGEDA